MIFKAVCVKRLVHFLYSLYIEVSMLTADDTVLFGFQYVIK